MKKPRITFDNWIKIPVWEKKTVHIRKTLQLYKIEAVFAEPKFESASHKKKHQRKFERSLLLKTISTPALNSHERSNISLVLEIKKKFAYVSFNMFPFLFIWVFFRLPRIQHKEQSMLNDRIIKNSNRNYFKSNCYLGLLNKFSSRLQSTDSCMPKRFVGSTHEERPSTSHYWMHIGGRSLLLYNNVFRNIVYEYYL